MELAPDRRGPGHFCSRLPLFPTTPCFAKARYSSIKATWTSSPKQAMDYTSNMGVWDFSPNPWTAPPSIMGPDS